jgi:osmotically-inducible protein OsmY
MHANKSVLILALTLGLVGLPLLSQNPGSPGPTSTSTQGGSSPTTGSAATDTPAPGSSGTTQTANRAGEYRSKAEHSPATAITGPSRSGDVKTNVQTSLQKDSQLAGQNVNVQLNKKLVVLSGTVSSQDQKDHAEKVAIEAAGSNYSVKNNINVSGGSSSTSEQPKP